VKKILVDSGELLAKSLVELLENLGRAFQGKKMKETWNEVKGEPTEERHGGKETGKGRSQRRKWEMAQSITERARLRRIEVVMGK
jgi:hypothetical protein